MKAKKIASVLVAAVLVLGLLPSVALANSSDDANAGDVDSAVSSADVFESTYRASDVANMTALESTSAPLATTTASGTLGTCTWTIDSEGCLTIAPEDGVAGKFSISGYVSSSSWPWYSYRADITSARVEQGVSASGSLAYMLSGATYLDDVDFSLLDVSDVTSISSMFNNCTFLRSVNLSGWNISNITSVSSLFFGFDFLESVDLSGWNTSNVTSMKSMLYNCPLLTSINLSDWDTSNVTDMSNMFYNCSSLASLDLSDWDTSNVTTMFYMFNGCSSLDTLNLSNLDTSSVTDMSRMFSECSSLVSLDLSAFDTSHVTTMSYMFYNCTSLTTLNMSGLDVTRVTSMNYMFYNCSSLVTLDLSYWDTSHLVNCNWIFYKCSSLASLDLSGFDMSHVTNVMYMFYCCTGLRTVTVGEKFVFIGSSYIPSGYLPVPENDGAKGWWVSDNGIVYDDPADIPSNVAATYTAAFPADKTELEMTIKAVAQLDESEYTSDSWAALQDVLQAAQRIDADDAASQAEVNEVTDALLAAIDALQKLFVDVSDPSTYYYEYVYYMAELGVITGYNETTFGVGDPMTRAQLVTIMWRYCEPDEYANYNETTAKNTSGLPDVPDGMYYTGAVNWAVSEGVVTGNQLADGSYVFSPDNNVSFEQMVTIVARYVLGFDGAEKYDTSALTRGAFTDAATVSNYARGSVAWAIENGVVTGNDNHNGTFTISPSENVARERAATVLARAIQSGLLVAE